MQQQESPNEIFHYAIFERKKLLMFMCKLFHPDHFNHQIYDFYKEFSPRFKETIKSTCCKEMKFIGFIVFTAMCDTETVKVEKPESNAILLHDILSIGDITLIPQEFNRLPTKALSEFMIYLVSRMAPILSS